MKIFFMTGLSDWNNSSLSPQQINFLKKINLQENNKIYMNFPFESNSKYKKTNILIASLSNSLQYMLARTSWIKKKEIDFKNLLAKENKILLLVGSCGLEILRNINLSAADKDKIHVIAYGGVAKKIPDYQHLTLVQGKNDWISRLWIKRYDLLINSNHMNYLDSQEFLTFINKYIKNGVEK